MLLPNEERSSNQVVNPVRQGHGGPLNVSTRAQLELILCWWQHLEDPAMLGPHLPSWALSGEYAAPFERMVRAAWLDGWEVPMDAPLDRLADVLADLLVSALEAE